VFEKLGVDALSFRMGKVGELKVGSYAIIDNEPSQIVSLQKSKPGKHGSAKFRCTAISLFDGSKRSFVSPADSSIHIPIVEKKSAQVVSVSPASVQLMDLESYDVFDAALPEDEEIRSRLVAGRDIEYWKIMGRNKIQRVKG
jgi:translation initiation factor 5A